jgi:hypothetical protein
VIRVMTATLGLSDFLTYIFAAALLLMAGTGLLLLLRAPFDRPTMILLGPIASQAVWAITVGLGLLCGLSVRQLAAPLLLGSVLLACVGLQRMLLRRKFYSSRDPLVAILVTCALAPVLVLLPYFVFGLADYPGSRLPDGWWYVGSGRHLWTYGYRADGMLEPLYRYPTFGLYGARYAASASLGVLSLLDHAGDTQRSVGLFLALALFTFGTSAAAVAVSREWQVGRSVFFVLLVVASGWAANAVYVNNYDNLLALGYFPAIAALVRVPQSRSRSSWILLGVIAAGLACTYPELGVAVLPVGFVMVAERSWKTRSWRDARGIGLAAVVFLLLTGPQLQSAIHLFGSQARAALQPTGQSSLRPGETLFMGLMSQKYRPSAFWSLGGEFLVPRLFRSQTAVAVLLFLLLACGIVRLLRARDFGTLAALTLPLVAAPVLIFVQAYDYGAFKMILIGWWAVVLCLVEATASWWRPGIHWRVLTGLSVAVCLAIPAVTVARSLTLALNVRDAAKVQVAFDAVSVAPRSMEQFRSVEEVQRIVGQEAVGIFVKDWEALEWATYFLRNAHTRLGVLSGYLDLATPYRSSLESSPYPWAGIRYILSDFEDPGPVVEAQSWTLVWRAGSFRLWDTTGSSWAIVTDVENPNGVERVAEKPFLWLGGGTTRLHVIAQGHTCLGVTGTMVPGPQVSRPDGRTMLIQSAIGPPSTITMTAGTNHFVVSLPPGASEVDLTPQDQPDRPAGNTDRRTLIAGLTDLRSSLLEPPRLIDIDNKNGLEQSLGEPFFWMGNGATRLRLRASRSGDVNLAADFMLGPSVAATVPFRRLRLTGPGFTNPIDIAVSGGPMTTRIPVEQGDTVVSMEALDPPTILRQPNGDPRPLILGVRGLHVVSDPCH